MPENANDRHDGHKLQLWVSDEIFAVLQRAASRHHVSLAEAARRLMQSGIAPNETLDAIAEELNELGRFVRLHIEPLLFVAAMDASKGTAYWKRRVYGESHRGETSAEQAQDIAEALDRQMAEQATGRVKRVLREVESPLFDLYEGEDARDDTEE